MGLSSAIEQILGWDVDIETKVALYEQYKDSFSGDDLCDIVKNCEVESVVKDAYERGKDKFDSDELYIITTDCNIESIARDAYERGKIKFDRRDQLYWILQDCKIESIVKDVYERGKDKFDSNQLYWIVRDCKFESIVKDAYERGKDKFDSEELYIIITNCQFESIVKDAKEKQSINKAQFWALHEAEVADSDSRKPESFTEFPESIMSNFDHEIDENVAEAIKDNLLYAEYSGWNFCGYVWWQNGNWCCEVWTYNSWKETFVADTLLEIMDEVSWAYGSD